MIPIRRLPASNAAEIANAIVPVYSKTVRTL
jgi:hypothetical protein